MMWGLAISTLSARSLRVLQKSLTIWLAETAVLDDATIRELNPDFPNMLRVADLGLAESETRQVAANLILQVFFWVESAGHITRWRPVITKCLHQMSNSNIKLRFQLLKQLGQYQRLQWELETAVVTFKQAQELAHQMQDSQAVAEIHMNLCQTYRRQHLYELAEIEGQTALTLFANNAPRQQAITWQSLGYIAKDQGNLAIAETHFHTALSINHHTPPVSDTARTLNALATIYQEQTQYEQALQVYQEVADLLANTHHDKDKIENQINQGTLFYNWNRLDNALGAFQSAEQMLKSQIGLISLKALAANNIACVWREHKEWAVAESYYRQSITFYQQFDDPLALAKTISNLAKCYAQQGNVIAALAHFDKASILVSLFPNGEQVQMLQKELADKKNKLVNQSPGGFYLPEIAILSTTRS